MTGNGGIYDRTHNEVSNIKNVEEADELENHILVLYKGYFKKLYWQIWLLHRISS